MCGFDTDLPFYRLFNSQRRPSPWIHALSHWIMDTAPDFTSCIIGFYSNNDANRSSPMVADLYDVGAAIATASDASV